MEDQRRFERYVTQRSIDCRPVSIVRDLSWPATICDVSLGGIGVSATRRFERGVLLMVQSGDGTHDGFLKLVQVRHVRPEGERQCFLGCAFVSELSAEELAAIRC
jgi:hypothetical protein